MRKILVIDDFIENILWIKTVLSKALFDVMVLEAGSGRMGIHLAREEDPDVILLDVMMPDMDGYKVCEVLRSDELTKSIPIILISANVKDSESTIKGLNLGAYVFLNKPISNFELVAHVEVALRMRNAENLLRMETHKYQIVAETFPEAVFTTGLKNKIAYSSTHAYSLFGYDRPADMVNMSILKLVHPENKKASIRCIEKIRKNRVVKNQSFRFVRKDGSDFIGELSGSLIKGGKDELYELIIVIRDITERRQSENRLLEYQEKLKTINSMLTIAEEKERKLIAESLHDGLGQILAITKIKLTSILTDTRLPESAEVIRESVEMIDTAIKETKALTYGYYFRPFYELGLKAAIKWKLDEITNDYGIRNTFIENLHEDSLSNDISILLFRIVSELLANVIKHAKATIVSIQLSNDQNSIYLSVADNGEGFNVDLNSPMSYRGFGLFNISERLDSIQGSMKVDSTVGKGSKITILLPFQTVPLCQ